MGGPRYFLGRTCGCVLAGGCGAATSDFWKWTGEGGARAAPPSYAQVRNPPTPTAAERWRQSGRRTRRGRLPPPVEDWSRWVDAKHRDREGSGCARESSARRGGERGARSRRSGAQAGGSCAGRSRAYGGSLWRRSSARSLGSGSRRRRSFRRGNRSSGQAWRERRPWLGKGSRG